MISMTFQVINSYFSKSDNSTKEKKFSSQCCFDVFLLIARTYFKVVLCSCSSFLLFISPLIQKGLFVVQ